MKKNCLFVLAVVMLLTMCKPLVLEPKETFIGTWKLAAIYINGGSVDMQDFVKMIKPCLKGEATLEFTADSLFNLQCDCDFMRSAGHYTVENENIFAKDTIHDTQYTKYFTFIDGSLRQSAEEGGLVFDILYKKIE
jgi:hypothetical protein